MRNLGRTARWVVASLAVLLALYTLAGFFLAPYLIRQELPQFLQQRLGVPVTVGEVRFNPFTFTLDATDFHVLQPPGTVIVGMRRVRVDWVPRAMVGKTWRFSGVRIEGLEVAVESGKDGRLNLARLAERLAGGNEASAGDSPRLAFGEIELVDSRITFTDLSGQERAGVTVYPVDVKISGITTFSPEAGRYSITAKVPQGGAFATSGTLTLSPFAVKGELDVTAFPLSTAWQFVRDRVRVASPAGVLKAGARYEVSGPSGKRVFALDQGRALITGLALAPRDGGQPLIQLKSLEATGASLRHPQGKAVVGRIDAKGGRVQAVMAADGTLDWQRLVVPEKSPTPSASWSLELAALALSDVAAHYSDRSRVQPLELDIASVAARLRLHASGGGAATRIAAEGAGVTLTGVDAGTPGGGKPRLLALKSAKLSEGRFDTDARTFAARTVELSGGEVNVTRSKNGQMTFAGTAVPRKAQGAKEPASWRGQIEALTIADVAAAYTDLSAGEPVELRIATVTAGLKLGANDAGLTAENADIGLTGIGYGPLGGRKNRALSLQSAKLTGGRLDTAARMVGGGKLELSGGQVNVVRGRSGRIRLVHAPGSRDAGNAAEPPAAASSAATPPWRYSLGLAEVRNFKAALADRTFDPVIRYDAEISSAVFSNIQSNATTPIAAQVALRITQGGSITATGTLSQDFARGEGKLEVRDLATTPLQPMVARYTTLELKSGTVTASSKFQYQQGNPLTLRLDAALTVSDLLVNEIQGGDRLLSWKTLEAGSVSFGLTPDRLFVKDVRIMEPGAKITIDKSRTVNLSGIVREQPDAKAGAKAGTVQREPAPVETAGAAGEQRRFPVRVDRVRIQQGTLDFADLSLALPFATRITELEGSMIGISSAPHSRADIQLEGAIPPYGLARAEGSISPWEPAVHTDIVAHFDNVQMPLLTPYSVTFAGREIDSGRLWLTLEYKVADHQLSGQNKIMLADFKLGERVESPSAMDLPLDLAVALLTDAKGEIHLAVPIHGVVGSPEFDYAGLVREAIGNLIQRVITAPFRFLAGLFGGGREGEEEAAVSFEPGSDELRPQEREDLARVAKGLQDRPQLKLVVRGPYDAARDTEALKRDAVRTELAQTTGVKLAPGDEPVPVAFGSSPVQRALEQMLAARGGAGAMEAFVHRFTSDTGRPPVRIGLLRRASTDRAFYEALFEQVAKLTPLPATALQDLARRRAEAIVALLLKSGADRARVSSGAAQAVEGSKDAGIEADLKFDTAS
jgi:hypothetical protein